MRYSIKDSVIKKTVRNFSVIGMLTVLSVYADSSVPNASGTAFVGGCSVRSDLGEFKSVGEFNLVVENNQEDCPSESFSLKGFHPLADGFDIYIEYQGSNASAKIMTDHSIGYNVISSYSAQVGTHLSAILTLNNGKQTVCHGDVVKIQK